VFASAWNHSLENRKEFRHMFTMKSGPRASPTSRFSTCLRIPKNPFDHPPKIPEPVPDGIQFVGCSRVESLNGVIRGEVCVITVAIRSSTRLRNIIVSGILQWCERQQANCFPLRNPAEGFPPNIPL
jgi:hypothetical protein